MHGCLPGSTECHNRRKSAAAQGRSSMVQDPTIAQASSDDDERAKVRRAQKVLERTSTSVGQVCLIILTVLAVALYAVLRRGDHSALRAGAGPGDGAGTGDAPDEPSITHSANDRGATADRRAVQRRGGDGLCAVRPASAWIAKAPQSLPALMDKLSFLEKPIQLVSKACSNCKIDVAERDRSRRSAGS